MFRKALGLLCTVMLVFLMLIGCSRYNYSDQNEPQDKSGGNADILKSNGEETQAQDNKPDFSKRFTITYPHIHGDKAGNDPMYEYISNKFNVDIQYIPVTWENWNEKCNAWIASGDLPDVLWFDLRAQQYAKFAEWCREGVFKEIPELGEKFPNLKRVLSYMPATEKFKVDGKTYVIPHYTEYIEMEKVGGVQFYYRKDWAIKVGMDKDVFTFEDLKAFVKACIEKDPGGNGPGVTTGIVGPSWAVPDHVFMMEGNPYFASYVKKDGKYVWGAALPETLEGIKICKELYEEGVIYRDFYTVNDMDGENLFVAGKAPVLVGSVDAYQLKQLRYKFAKSNPGINASNAVVPMKVLGPHGKTLVEEEYGFWSASSFNNKIEDEKMERILYMMDWCCTREAEELYNYGIKGKDWDIVDGKFKQLWETDENGNYIRPYYMDYAAVYCLMGTNGGQYSFSNNLSFDDKLKKDITDWVKWRKSAPQSVRKLDPELDFLFTPNKSKYGSFAQEIKDEIKRLIIGSNDIERDWNEWLEYMKPKVDLVLEEINSALADKESD